jgi:TonB family protein
MWKKLVVSLFVVVLSIPALAATPPETPAPPQDVLRPTAEEWCPEGVAPSQDADCVTLPVLISAVPAPYPELALKGRISGQVDLEIVVNAAGRVGDVVVVRPNRVFTDAAVAAVKQRRYKPATRRGVPVTTAFPVMVKFDFAAPAGNPLASQKSGAGELVTVTPYDTKPATDARGNPAATRDTQGGKK